MGSTEKEVQIVVYSDVGEDSCTDEKWVRRRYRMSETDYNAIQAILLSRHNAHCGTSDSF